MNSKNINITKIAKENITKDDENINIKKIVSKVLFNDINNEGKKTEAIIKKITNDKKTEQRLLSEKDKVLEYYRKMLGLS